MRAEEEDSGEEDCLHAVSVHLPSGMSSAMTISEAMRHPDVMGAGARKRKKLHSAKDKMATVMKEFARGTLYSGSGHKVTKRAQALAIGMHESGQSQHRTSDYLK